jgi:hypothetical protein
MLILTEKICGMAGGGEIWPTKAETASRSRGRIENVLDWASRNHSQQCRRCPQVVLHHWEREHSLKPRRHRQHLFGGLGTSDKLVVAVWQRAAERSSISAAGSRCARMSGVRLISV